MKEHPIIFSGPMVRAILEGRKTMTRRVVKNMPSITLPGVNRIRLELHPFSKTALAGTPGEAIGGPDRLAWIAYDWVENAIGVEEAAWLRCPYGQPGDRLWVRETWWMHDSPRAFDLYDCNATMPNGEKRLIGYDATMGADSLESARAYGARKRPSIHMPRWASRILLEVTAVRVERVQDISKEDAKREGLRALTKDGLLFKYGIPDRDGFPGTDDYGWPWADWKTDPRVAFRSLWDSINAKRGYGWDANPWVWVVEFKQVDK